MAETSYSVPGLVTLAFAASVGLYEAVDSYNSPLQRVHDLLKESTTLSDELGLLSENARYSAAPVLSTPEILLRRRSEVCEEFEQKLQE
jgi:Fungal N-terminal domain of STAND proteins